MIKVNYDEKTGRVIAFNKDSSPYIEITEQERRQPLPDKYSYYAVIDGKFTIVQRTPTEDETNRDNIQAKNKRLAEIDKWLKDNDWKLNKVYLGEWTKEDPRWVDYLETRKLMRAERDTLLEQLMEDNQ